MLVGVVGPPCAGKGTLCELLVKHHGFKLLRTSTVLDRANGSRTTGASAVTMAPCAFVGTDARRFGNFRSRVRRAATPAASKDKCGAGAGAAHSHADEDRMTLSTRKRARISTGGTAMSPAAACMPGSASSKRELWPAVRALRQRAGADAFAKAAWTQYMDDWKSNYVIEWPIDSVDDILLLRQRSLFFLYGVTASTAARFARHQRCLDLCDDLIVNEGGTDELARGLVLRVERRLAHTQHRPSWNTYFMRLAFLAARRSNCMKRRVGAIVVRDNHVVSTGYNGTPRGLLNCSQGGCPRCNSNAPTGSGLDECLCLHAEENAIMEAGAERCRGCTIYTTSFPCLQCTKRIIQGIQRVVFAEVYATDDAAGSLLGKAGIEVVTARDEVRVYRWHDLDCRDGDVGGGSSMAPVLLEEPEEDAASVDGDEGKA